MNTSKERTTAFVTVITMMELEGATAEFRMGEWKLRVGKGYEFMLLTLTMRYTNENGVAHSPYRTKHFTLQDGAVYVQVHDWLEQATEELKQVRRDLGGQ